MLPVVLDHRHLRAIVATLVVAAASLAWAFSPPVGSEVMITDRDGATLIGFGVVRESGLALELSVDAAEWRVVIVAPDGWSSPYQASWDGQRLTFEGAEGDRVDVADALAAEGRGLTLAWWDGTRVDVSSDVVVASEEGNDDAATVAVGEDGDADVAADNRPGDEVTSAADPRDEDEDDGDEGSDPVATDPPTSEPPAAGPDPDDPPTNRPGDEDDDDQDDGTGDEGTGDDPPSNRPDPPTDDGAEDGSNDASEDDGGANRR
jgi:hypothetical protein